MDKETIIRLAQEAGMIIYEGDQDRLMYDGSIIEALSKFAELAKGNETTVRVSLDDVQIIELKIPDGLASSVVDAIKDAFKKGEESAKALIIKLLTPSPSA